MADSTLTALTAASALTGAELLYVVQGGADRKATAAQLGASARTKLTADTTFYIATTGNDTTGTGAVGAPWLTPQKALDYLEENIDIAGFIVTIRLAAGTVGTPAVYPNVEVPHLIGYGQVYVDTSDGNPLTTTLGDLAGNFTAIFAYEDSSSDVYFGGMTIYSAGSAILQNADNFIGIGTVACPNVAIRQVGGGSSVIGMISGKGVFYDGGAGALPTITVQVDAVIDRFIDIGDSCTGINVAHYVFTGAHNFANAFADVHDNATYVTSLQVGGSVTGGAITGRKFNAYNLSNVVLVQPGTLANMPGNAAPTFWVNSLFNGNFFDVTFSDGTNGITTLRAGAATASRTYVLPVDFGPPGGSLTDAAGNGTLGWLPPVTAVSALPAAATANKGVRRFVSDATVTTFASIVAGTGSNIVPVYSDGTNWRIG